MEADLEGRLTRGIAAIQREVGFSAHLNYRDPGGTEAERDPPSGCVPASPTRAVTVW
jgi:hypothetical protein